MSRPAEPGGTLLTIVGCGTAVPDAERVCSGHFVETGSVRLLLDCGPGVVHHLARFGLSWQRITHLALTHFHTDHVGDVPMLFFALRHGMAPGRTDPLTVLGPRGTRALLDGLAEVFGEHLHDPGFPVEVLELHDQPAVRLDDVTRMDGGLPRTPPHPSLTACKRRRARSAIPATPVIRRTWRHFSRAARS